MNLLAKLLVGKNYLPQVGFEPGSKSATLFEFECATT